MSSITQKAEHAIKAGDTKSAFDLVRQAIAEDPDSERAWWIMSGLVPRDERATCLEQVLRINPENAFAREALNKLKTAPPKPKPEPKPEPKKEEDFQQAELQFEAEPIEEIPAEELTEKENPEEEIPDREDREAPQPPPKAPVTTLPDEFKTWHFTKRNRLNLIILGQERLIRAKAQADLIPRIKAALRKKLLPHEYLEEIKSIRLDRIQSIREVGPTLHIQYWDGEVERTTRFTLINSTLATRILDYLAKRLSPDYELKTTPTRSYANMLIAVLLVFGAATFTAVGYWLVISDSIKAPWLQGAVIWLGPGGISLVGAVVMLISLGISGALLFKPKHRRELAGIGLD